MLIILLVMVGCSSAEEDLIGKWQRVNGNETLQLYKDGSLTYMTTGLFGSSNNGDYRIIDDTRIRIRIPGLFSTSDTIYKFRVEKGQLYLTDPSGAVVQYGFEGK